MLKRLRTNQRKWNEKASMSMILFSYSIINRNIECQILQDFGRSVNTNKCIFVLPIMPYMDPIPNI